jgi:hypothetical protein
VVLLSEVTDQLTGSGSSGIRGSLGIDRVNKAVYASYAVPPPRCLHGQVHVCSSAHHGGSGLDALLILVPTCLLRSQAGMAAPALRHSSNSIQHNLSQISK